MEQVIDRLVEELNLISEIDYEYGGFKDEIDLADTVWWGDPKTAADQQYPLIYVQPVLDAPAAQGGTNSQVWRDLTIEIACLADPRVYYDESEIVEATTSRELVRVGTAIRRHMEKINLAWPGGLSDNVRSVTVTEVSYPDQTRGALLLSSVVLTVVVQKAYDRIKT